METNKKTIDIILKYIPDYLKSSEFYNNLDINDTYINENDTITIPSINFKKDRKIRNFDELMNLLHTLRFWMAPIEDFYYSIFNFVKMCNDIRYKYLYEEFYDMDIINDIKYLHQIYFIERTSVPVILTDDNFNKVCELGLLYLLKYFHKKCFKYNDNMPYNCIQYGNFECLKYLHSNGFYIDENMINTCCFFGQIDCLKYLHKNGFTIGEGCVNCCIGLGGLRLVSPSVKYNYFECLKYCLENGGKLSSTSYAYLHSNNNVKKIENFNKENEKIKKYIYDNYDLETIIKEEDELRKKINGYIDNDNFDY